MDPVTLSGIFSIGSKIIDHFFPNKEEAEKAKFRLLEMQQTGELAALAADTELAKGQLAVNAKEAEHSDVFVAGWRPFIGWVCGVGFLYSFLLQPFLVFLSVLSGVPGTDFPVIDVAALMTLALGMLGLGGLRTYEKQQGVARSRIKEN